VKLCFVVQRYGADVAGGSEAHCRELALRLAARRHAITVVTSCARDYVTWENSFPAGESRDADVRVLRFPVSRQRRLGVFADLGDEVFGGGASIERQHEWFRENGPDAPGIIEHLRTHGAGYDLVLFWTFRYAPSFFGLPLVAGRAVLVPTAEDDSAVQLEAVEAFFRLPAGYLFLTPEEEALVSMRAGRTLTPSAVIGIGLEPEPPRGAAASPPGLPADYVLYLGRVDRNKGCHTLLEYFDQYAASVAGTLPVPTLVLAGPAKMRIPDHPQIRALGYVSAELRSALLAHARVLIVPSPYESLSIVLLEAWNAGVPALVNGQCRVLEGQVRRAGGGLYYRSADEFREALAYLFDNRLTRDVLGQQGRAYVDREYRWPIVIDRVERLLADVRSRITTPTSPAAT
jgi:glycosyltransferase involved in cell wall biosynthesis